jgi:hypothetical protein
VRARLRQNTPDARCRHGGGAQCVLGPIGVLRINGHQQAP